MEAIGYHTVEDRENPDHVEEYGPFLCGGSLAFLGVGHYFWEENIDLAHWWGQTHCDNEYMICSGDIKCEDSLYLDILGNVKHQKYLREIQKMLGEDLIRQFGTVDVPLGALIEFLKKIESYQHKKGIFPYKVIRAIDSSARSSNLIKFAQGKPNYSDLSPRIIICLIEKKKLFLTGFKIVFPLKYVEGG
jgi:hypothetical protein